MQEEIWKDIVGYEGYYQASNLGNIRSLDRLVNGKFSGYKNSITGIVLKKINEKNGYHCVNLMIRGIRSTQFVHRLIALTFIPNPENKRTVNHINGIKTDNNLCNLEWATHSENTIHAVKIGLRNNKNK